MSDISALLDCLQGCVSGPTLRQWSRIIGAMLAMTGRVTMLGLSRWTEPGGSYRSVQRFFSSVIPWTQGMWLFIRQHLLDPDEVYILVGDEVVVTKAGQHTYGVDRFFSGVQRQTVPGLAFFALALVGTRQRRAFPLQLQQVVRTEAEKEAARQRTAAKKQPKSTPARPPGRPKGRQTQSLSEVVLTPDLQRIQAMLQTQQQLIGSSVGLTYLVLDGQFGHRGGLSMTRQCDLHLISKLRSDAAVYAAYEGPQARRGARRKYGAKLDYQHLPAAYLKETQVASGVQTQVYQAQLLHKDFRQALNVVVIVKTKLANGARAHVVLFSSDLSLGYASLIDYYTLRFQIEFTFRDAKQYWGLEDFMNVQQTAVTNFATLSLFMVNVGHVLLGQWRQAEPQASILDLKAAWRAHTYVKRTLQLLPHPPTADLIAPLVRQVARLGAIHPSKDNTLAA